MHVRGTTNIAALCDFGDNSKFEQWPPSCRKPCALVLLSSLPSGASKPPRPEQHLRLHYSNAVAISKLPSLGFATARTNLKHTAYVLVKGRSCGAQLGTCLYQHVVLAAASIESTCKKNGVRSLAATN